MNDFQESRKDFIRSEIARVRANFEAEMDALEAELIATLRSRRASHLKDLESMQGMLQVEGFKVVREES